MICKFYLGHIYQLMFDILVLWSELLTAVEPGHNEWQKEEQVRRKGEEEKTEAGNMVPPKLTTGSDVLDKRPEDQSLRREMMSSLALAMHSIA